MLTEANGVPLAIVVAGANRNDFKLARETLESIVIARPKPTRDEPQGLCLDKGYDYDEVRELADAFRFTAHIRRRGEEARAAKKTGGFKALAGWSIAAQLDEPIPKDPHPLGEASRHLSRHAPSRLRPHHLESVPSTGIGS